MEAAAIHEAVKAKFGDKIGDLDDSGIDPFFTVEPDAILDVSRFLKDESSLAFNQMMCLSGVDIVDNQQVVYHLFSFEHRHRITLKVDVPTDNPKTQSVESVWKTANWHERECYDLFGIVFEGHPDPRRILLPDDWVGYPLRKDYVYPSEYDGIDNTFGVPTMHPDQID